MKSKRRQRIENLVIALGIYPPARGAKDPEALARFKVAYKRVKKFLRAELREHDTPKHLPLSIAAGTFQEMHDAE